MQCAGTQHLLPINNLGGRVVLELVRKPILLTHLVALLASKILDSNFKCNVSDVYGPLILRLHSAVLAVGPRLVSSSGSPGRAHYDTLAGGIWVHGIRASMSLSR